MFTWFRSVRDPVATSCVRFTLAMLLAFVSKPELAGGRLKESFALFSPARFRDNRRSRANVYDIGMLVFDDDAAHLELFTVVRHLRSLGWMAYVASTYSTDDDRPTWRLLIPLLTAVGADTYDRLHALVRARLAALGHEIPRGAIDAAHAWYPPVDRGEEGRTYRYAVVDGPLLDPLALAAEADEAWAASRKRVAGDEARESRAVAVGGRPGDRWAAATSWAGILEPCGWTFLYQRGDVQYWRRPGKAHGASATTNYGASGLLYVFTDAAPPFEPQRAYSKFSAYALLEHAGDFRAAAVALRRRGFGDDQAPPESSPMARAAARLFAPVRASKRAFARARAAARLFGGAG
jgi:hypothetical protein